MTILLIFCVGLALTLFQSILTPGFLHLEALEVQKDIERVENAIEGELRRLNTNTKDYAAWDDMYAFVQTQNPEFSKSNLTHDLAASLNLNLIFILDIKRDVVWKQVIDLQSTEALSIGSLPDISFPRNHPLLVLDDKQNPISLTSGIFITDIGPLLVSVRPINTSYGEGPPRGWLIMGRLLDSQKIRRISEQTKLSVSLQTDFHNNSAHHTSHKLTPNSWYETPSKEMLTAYVSLPCVRESNRVTIEIKIPRDIFLRGEKTRNIMMQLVFFSLFFIFTLLSLLLKKFIISPITTLTSNIMELEESKNIQMRIPQEPGFYKDEACILTNQVNRLLDTIETMHSQLEADARLDSLTGLANRRCYEEHLGREWKNLIRTQASLSLIVCDIDHFKLYNDTYGHQQGDECLQTVADLIRSVPRRPLDLVYRYGGEEFVILLPDTNLAEGVRIAEKVKEKISSSEIPHKASLEKKVVTMSFGVAAISPTNEISSDTLFRRADKALYQAKERGRNQVCFHEATHAE